MSDERRLPWLLRVDHADSATRSRAVNALVLTYGTIAAGVLGAIPLSMIPNGPQIAAIVVLTTLVFVVAAVLLRQGKVNAGLAVFFTAFLAAFAAVPLVGHDARLSGIYCATAVAVAGVTLRRLGLAVVTVLALTIAIVGTWLYPPVDPPPGAFEIITAAGIITILVLVTSVLGRWAHSLETRRADRAAQRATELAATLRQANAELEARVAARTEELQLALSRQESLVAELADLSMRDPLTGMYNRRHTELELPRLMSAAARYGQPLAIALADLDHFKQVNDDHSYSTGDEVLLRFAQIMKDTARGSDLLARYGGEEFLFVMPQTTLDQAVVLCERLRRSVAGHPWSDVVPELSLTVSIGVADSSTLDDLPALIATVDAALHRAKREGRNRVETAQPGH